MLEFEREDDIGCYGVNVCYLNLKIMVKLGNTLLFIVGHYYRIKNLLLAVIKGENYYW